jgi:hypothetical protein
MGSHSSKDIYEVNIEKCMCEITKYEKLIKEADEIHLHHIINCGSYCFDNCIEREKRMKKIAEERINYYENRIKSYNNLKNNVDTTIQDMPDAPPQYDSINK